MTNHAPLTADKPASAAPSSFSIVLESDEHMDPIETLHDTVFGPGRFARAAFRVREQGPYDQAMSHVAVCCANNKLLGSVRQTWIMTSDSKSRGLLLGPLCVLTDMRNQGIGRALVAKCVEQASGIGANYVMLVGDQSYYGPLGFEVIPKGKVLMPGPVDLNRLLLCPIGGFDPAEVKGTVAHVAMFGG